MLHGGRLGGWRAPSDPAACPPRSDIRRQNGMDRRSTRRTSSASRSPIAGIGRLRLPVSRTTAARWRTSLVQAPMDTSAGRAASRTAARLSGSRRTVGFSFSIDTRTGSIALDLPGGLKVAACRDFMPPAFSGRCRDVPGTAARPEAGDPRPRHPSPALLHTSVGAARDLPPGEDGRHPVIADRTPRGCGLAARLFPASFRLALSGRSALCHGTLRTGVTYW